jgi:Domain of unknown function (DUF4407)
VVADQAVAAQRKAQLDQAQAQPQAAELGASSTDATSLQTRKADASAQLPALANKLADLQNEENEDLQQDERRVADSTGMAARLEALWDLSLRYPEVAVLHIAIVLTLIAIEWTPSVTKTLILLGNETLAERLGRLRDDELVERRRDDAERLRRLEDDLFEVERRVALEKHEAACSEIYDIWLERVVADARVNPDQYLISDN